VLGAVGECEGCLAAAFVDLGASRVETSLAAAARDTSAVYASWARRTAFSASRCPCSTASTWHVLAAFSRDRARWGHWCLGLVCDGVEAFCG